MVNAKLGDANIYGSQFDGADMVGVLAGRT